MPSYLQFLHPSNTHIEIIDVTRISAPGSNVVALVDFRSAGIRINSSRLILLPNGSPRLYGPQMRLADPATPHPILRTQATWSEVYEKEFGAVAAAYLISKGEM